MKPIRIILVLAVAAIVAIPVVASSAFEGGSSTTTQSRDIVQTAKASGNFKTLTALLKRAGLAGTLKGKGPYTVFAPTDKAFAKVPRSTLAALGRDRAQLRSVLLYHVAKGKLTAARVVKRSSVKTLQGQSLKVRVRGSKVTVGGARVTTPDVMASNGVIHVINKVLIPR